MIDGLLCRCTGPSDLSPSLLSPLLHNLVHQSKVYCLLCSHVIVPFESLVESIHRSFFGLARFGAVIGVYHGQSTANAEDLFRLKRNVGGLARSPSAGFWLSVAMYKEQVDV